jgi:hypothetical protein
VKNILATLALLLTVGCDLPKVHDPAKWYLTGYENEHLVIQHDHMRYVARCFQSFSVGRQEPDATPQCSDMLVIPGIGHEIPEKHWFSASDFAYFSPMGDDGPQYQLIFISIMEDK